MSLQDSGPTNSEVLASESSGRVSRAIRRPSTWVLVVAIAYGITQFAVLDPELFLGWDEAVYVSEVSRFANSVGLAAHRSRGITLIVAPVVQVSDSMVALRSYLVLVSSAAFFASFLVWCRVVGWAAPLAATLFATSWMALFFGSQVTPNIYSAFLVVCALGIAVRFLRSGSKGDLGGVVALSGFSAFVRPLDALALVAGLVVAGLVINKRSALRLSVAAAVGFALGMLPWIIEAWVRFGGPVARLRRVRELVGGGITNNLTEYADLMDGPIVLSDGPTQINQAALLVLCVLLGLGVLGAFAGGHVQRRVGRAVMICSAISALPYLVGADVATSRFILPALALLYIASGIGLTWLLSLPRVRVVAAGGFVALLVLSIAWNVPVLLSIMTTHVGSGERVVLLGAALKERSPDGDCFFLSPSGHPQISVASGCRSFRLTGDLTEDATRVDLANASGLDVFVWMVRNRPPDVIGDGWVCVDVNELAATDWQLCELV